MEYCGTCWVGYQSSIVDRTKIICLTFVIRVWTLDLDHALKVKPGVCPPLQAQYTHRISFVLRTPPDRQP